MLRVAALPVLLPVLLPLPLPLPLPHNSVAYMPHMYL